MIKNMTLYLKGLLQRHPLLAGLAVAIAFTLLFNLHSLFAAATLPVLLSILPCLLMIGLCMKNMGGETACEQKTPDQPLVARSLSETKVVDQESRHA
ncbi:hypothetical protein D3879_13865 [Pseudomonas cavernicola]|uniref:DUF2933 domain-containing protein n=1 Tax=Pseudomonas cavernicola TaxID=2320866 RepID=A0A418XP37_9PSED|nr:hypothetical protein [Pseudomonas cavernicola]RJG14239.1 hypothetical protein D3879_13865 [Pseudomonas cavernicola]